MVRVAIMPVRGDYDDLLRGQPACRGDNADFGLQRGAELLPVVSESAVGQPEVLPLAVAKEARQAAAEFLQPLRGKSFRRRGERSGVRSLAGRAQQDPDVGPEGLHAGHEPAGAQGFVVGVGGQDNERAAGEFGGVQRKLAEVPPPRLPPTRPRWFRRRCG